jgi:hypothetical protein
VRSVPVVILFFVSVAGCSAAPAPRVLHPEYRYVASYAPGPFTPGATFHVVWIPGLVRTDSAEPYDVRLCIGVFGSFENPSALKEAGSRSSGTRPDCPPAGAAVSSGVLRTRSDSGNPLSADLVLPRVNGFYDVREIAINGVEPTYSATSSGGVIGIRGP